MKIEKLSKEIEMFNFFGSICGAFFTAIICTTFIPDYDADMLVTHVLMCGIWVNIALGLKDITDKIKK